AVAGLEPARVSAALRAGRAIGISVGGNDHEIAPDDLLVAMKPLEGYQVEREGSHAVALELELDEDLRREGLARDIVRAVQVARQQAGLKVTDRIALTLDGDDSLIEAARAHQDYIAGETLATAVSYEDLDGAAPVEIEGRELLNHRRDHPTRATPRRPEVHEHGDLRLNDLGLEVGVSYLGDDVCHGCSLSSYFRKYSKTSETGRLALDPDGEDGSRPYQCRD